MKRILMMLFAMLMCMSGVFAKAEHFYIFPESSQRLLTQQELAAWNYDTLGIAYHEILARHGYCFDKEGAYYAYFANQDWYQESEAGNEAVYGQLSKIETQNVDQIKEYRKQMKAKGTSGRQGKDVYDVIARLKEASPYPGFERVYLGPSKMLDVYTGPGEEYFRLANGEAVLSTNGDVYCAGYEGDWLLVLYETNEGLIRTGYVQFPAQGVFPDIPALSLERKNAAVKEKCFMTETPDAQDPIQRWLWASDGVTYLGSYENTSKWAYIEVTIWNKNVRGYVPYEMLQIFDDGAFKYSVYYGDAVGITGYIGDDKELVIPKRIDGKKVTAIEAYAFDNHSGIRKVILPDGLARIDKKAFAGCRNLVEVTMPNSLWFIRDAAFENCASLTNVVLPGKVKEIGSKAFANCPNLGDVVIKASKADMDDTVFQGSQVRLIVYRGSKVEEYAKEHGIEYADYSAYLKAEKEAAEK